MAQREKVITPYFIGGGFPVVRYHVAVAANKGADDLLRYIEGMRSMWRDIQANPGDLENAKQELNDLAEAGKYAVKIYEKHFEPCPK